MGENGTPKYHQDQAKPETMSDEAKQKDRNFHKKQNRDARTVVSDSIHKRVKLIVHRADYSIESEQEYNSLSKELSL